SPGGSKPKSRSIVCVTRCEQGTHHSLKSPVCSCVRQGRGNFPNKFRNSASLIPYVLGRKSRLLVGNICLTGAWKPPRAAPSGNLLPLCSRYETAHLLTECRNHWDRRRIYRDDGRKSHSEFGGEQALGRVCGEARFPK